MRHVLIFGRKSGPLGVFDFRSINGLRLFKEVKRVIFVLVLQEGVQLGQGFEDNIVLDGASR